MPRFIIDTDKGPSDGNLEHLNGLDMTPDPAFQRIVQIATRLLSAPNAMITLIGPDGQQPKAHVRTATTDHTNALRLCAAAIDHRDEDAYVVHDVDAKVRFFAGQPLRPYKGRPAVGVLCVFDQREHRWTDADQAIFHDLVGLTEHLIGEEVNRRLTTGLHHSGRREAALLETVHDGLTIQDAAGRIVQWNPTAERVLGLTSDEISGRTSLDPRWAAIHADGTPWPGETHPAMQALTTGRPVRNVLMGIHRPRASLVWLRVSSTPFVEADGAVSGTLTSFTDVTGIVEPDRASLLEHIGQRNRPVRPEFDIRLVELATQEFVDALERTRKTLTREQQIAQRILDDLGNGIGLSDTIGQVTMSAEHESLTSAISDLEAARRDVRVQMFRALQAEGYSIGEIARFWGVSRQLASRILREAKQTE